MRRKGKGKVLIAVSTLVILVVIVLGGGLLFTAGGRANKVQVSISSSKVTDIQLLEQTEKRPSTFTDELFGRVIQSQSLQVDTISGATLSSKAYLKAIEHALEEAQK